MSEPTECVVATEPVAATECIICYEDIGDKNCCTTGCGHKFCFKCIATAMQYNNACPYCRTSLVDMPEEEEDDEDDEDDEDEENEENEANVEEIVARLQEKGISMVDVVSLLIGRYTRTRETEEDVEESLSTLHNRVWDAIVEVDDEVMEQNEMMAEDIRSKSIAPATVFTFNA